VILDDLGVHSATSWAQEKLFQLLNHRYNHRLPTVFTTSVPLEEMDDRLRTRLGDPSLSQVFL
ncbi:MAG: ATP-binding protein, partial [Anaerolineae bacterium]|nr:ATP-binding protein [Anaerolineae bacterium]